MPQALIRRLTIDEVRAFYEKVPDKREEVRERLQGEVGRNLRMVTDKVTVEVWKAAPLNECVLVKDEDGDRLQQLVDLDQAAPEPENAA